MESLTPDGGVKKRLSKAGEGAPPGQNARVYIHYTMRETNGKVIESSRMEEEEFTFRVGKEQVVPGVEMVVRTMVPGEIAVAQLSGDYIPKRCKGKTVVEIEIKLIRVEDVESKKALLRMSPHERLEAAKKCKEDGNAFFKEAKYSKAMKEYKKAQDYLYYVFYDAKSSDPAVNGNREGEEAEASEGQAAVDMTELKQMLNKVKVSTCNNLALCYAKDGMNQKVIQCANEVLQIEPENTKALYHRGMARTSIGDTDDAKADLTRAAKLNPSDVRIRNELSRLEKKIASHRKREKKAYGAMFAS